MSTDKQIVKLNIGGTVFQTTKSTLTRFDGMFRVMMETAIPVIEDESGAIFIDRSPKHFDLILNYMRDGEVAIPKAENEILEISKEAQYYLLTGLMELCKASVEIAQSTVTLNLRGTVFQTPRANLRKFAGYLNNLVEAGKKTDCFFIDRSPKHFNLILDFMSDRTVPFPDDLKEVKEINREAEFYKIRLLCDLCEEKAIELTKTIKLNVGGTIFQTEKSLIEGLLSNHCLRFQSVEDVKDQIFVDRSPKHFNVILEYKRNRDVVLPSSIEELKEVQKEADYYGDYHLNYECSTKIKKLQNSAEY